MNLNENIFNTLRKVSLACLLWEILFVAACLSVPLSVYGDSTDCTAITSITTEGLYSIGNTEFMSLIDIKKGDLPDQRALSRSVKRLFKKEIFDDILVKKEYLPESPCNIRFYVREREIINSINIEGNLFFNSSFIKKHLAFETGDRLNIRQISRSVEHMIGLIRQSGFPRASLSYEIIPQGKGRVEVKIILTEGVPQLIKEIRLEDKIGILNKNLRLSVGEPYSILEMNRMEGAIKEYMRHNFFIQTSFGYSYEDGILAFSFNPGKQIRIHLIGNEAISANLIQKELPGVEMQDFQEELAEEFRKRIINLYHTRGYPFVQIVPSTEEGTDFINLYFFIFEGKRYVVEDTEFKGATVSKDILNSLLFLYKDSPFNENLIDDDTASLQEYYASIGYTGALINKPEVIYGDEKVKIVFQINEGRQQRIADVVLQNNRLISSERILSELKVKKGSPLNELELAESKRKILDIYRKTGLADVRVHVKKDALKDDIIVTFIIEEGRITLFGKSLFKGNKQTRYEALYREMLHRENDLFEHAIVLRERQRLYRTGLFSDVQIDLSEPYGNETGDEGAIQYKDVTYFINEAPAGVLEFGAGYGEYERFRGFVEVGYKNLWGMNRQGSLRTELSSLEQRYILSYFDPWFFGENLPLKGILLHEKRTEQSIDTREVRYRLRRTIASLGIERKISERINFEFFYDFSVVDTFDVKPDIVLSKEDTGTLIISGLRPGIIYDTRDSPFEPKEGMLAGITAKLASSVLLSQTDFAKLSFYVNKYYSLSKEIVFAASLRGGIAKGFRNTQELPLVERFFLGGRTTVRGYEQDTLGPKGSDGNPTGGNVFAMTNLEFRTNIGKGIGIVTFLDAGNVWQTTGNLSNLKYTAGAGLRYNTPVGPFRVDYGFKLNRDSGESKGEIHFSLGHAF